MPVWLNSARQRGTGDLDVFLSLDLDLQGIYGLFGFTDLF